MKKLGILLMPIMAISLLASCGGEVEPGPGPEPTKTFTITINEISHFTPDAYTFTFEEDDFSPIEVPYKIDEGYVVTNTDTNAKKSYCDFDTLEKKLTIYPLDNKDFEINVSVTHLDQVRYVKIANPLPTHLTVKKKVIPFRKDDFREVYFPFELEEYCSVEAYRNPGKGDCDVKIKDNKIAVTPKEFNDIEILTSVTEQYKVVNFNPLQHASLARGAQASIKMPYGKTWGECVNKNVQKAVYEDNRRIFQGWSFGSFLYNEIISDDYRINESTPTIVYAIFFHTINLDSKSLELESQSYDAAHNIKLFFNFKDVEHYDIPKVGDFSISTGTRVPPTPITDFTYKAIATGILITIKKNFLEIHDDVINVTVDEDQPVYNVSYHVDEHLKYDDDFNNVPRKGDDFVFLLEAINDPSMNEAFYTVPYEITFMVGRIRVVDPKAYEIVDISETHDRTKARVTIFGSFVKDDLEITMSADTGEGYHYSVNGYGVNVTSPTDTDGYVLYGTQFEINMTSEGSLPSEGNVLMKINDGWYTCESLPEKYKTHITLNADKSKVTIDSSINDINNITFYIFDPTYSVFQNSDWATINKLSTLPVEYLKKFFVLGETRNVEGEKNTFRIIGFGHDRLTGSSNNAGLTIELANVVTDANNQPCMSHLVDGDRRHQYDYHNQVLDNYLNSDFITSELPAQLQPLIKMVNKAYYHNDSEEPERRFADVKIFPLSNIEYGNRDEYGRDEGSTYEYYATHGEASRIKKTIGPDGAAVAYWTRSILFDPCFINENGQIARVDTGAVDRGISAAFCI